MAGLTPAQKKFLKVHHEHLESLQTKVAEIKADLKAEDDKDPDYHEGVENQLEYLNSAVDYMGEALEQIEEAINTNAT